MSSPRFGNSPAKTVDFWCIQVLLLERSYIFNLLLITRETASLIAASWIDDSSIVSPPIYRIYPSRPDTTTLPESEAT